MAPEPNYFDRKTAGSSCSSGVSVGAMPSKKKRKRVERQTLHPRNKYSEKPPDFQLLASIYPSFEPFVFYSRDGRPRIDWTDYNATRELTRVLLLHDHGINWWIPDGQLCPTVPNRSNYIHWIEELLLSGIIENTGTDGDIVRGFDIGTGANCIYPLLGASLLGWSFVGSDVADVALEWARRNVRNNPHISELIEIRKVDSKDDFVKGEDPNIGQTLDSDGGCHLTETRTVEAENLASLAPELYSGVSKSYTGPPVLVGVIKDCEKFDFCMCNPPFFETMEAAGLNSKTSCGGTAQEMVCPGGEEAFICRIIEDSVHLKQSFRWFTSMVGRKSNLKLLISKLWSVGVTIVKTTEFVQGQTCRWGLAWSFLPPIRNIVSSYVAEKTNLSFMLEGIHRQYGAFHVLKSVESFFLSSGASCELDASSFNIDVTSSKDHCDEILKNNTQINSEATSCKHQLETLDSPNCSNCSFNVLRFRISVFQQIPGTLLVRGDLKHEEVPMSGAFSLIFQRLEIVLRKRFCREKA